MENREMKNKIKCSIQEIIALSNFKEEIATQNLKRKKICHIALPTCAIFILGGFILVNNNNSLIVEEAKTNEIIDYEQENTLSEDKTENISISIAEIMEKVDKNKIFYEEVTDSSNNCFAFEPTIENLYKNSDIIIVGTYSSSGKVYVDGFNIRTEAKFDVDKVIKNTTKINVDNEVVFSRSGGILTLDKYLEDSQTMIKGEFADISEENRKDYYVIQAYDPENRLDFESKNDNTNKYIIFLNYIEEEDKLMPNSLYYGIREIKDNKVYNYDTKSFEEIENEEITQVLNEIN